MSTKSWRVVFAVLALLSACDWDFAERVARCAHDTCDAGLDAGAIDSGVSDAGRVDAGEPPDAGGGDAGNQADAGRDAGDGTAVGKVVAQGLPVGIFATPTPGRYWVVVNAQGASQSQVLISDLKNTPVAVSLQTQNAVIAAAANPRASQYLAVLTDDPLPRKLRIINESGELGSLDTNATLVALRENVPGASCSIWGNRDKANASSVYITAMTDLAIVDGGPADFSLPLASSCELDFVQAHALGTNWLVAFTRDIASICSPLGHNAATSPTGTVVERSTSTDQRGYARLSADIHPVAVGTAASQEPWAVLGLPTSLVMFSLSLDADAGLTANAVQSLTLNSPHPTPGRFEDGLLTGVFETSLSGVHVGLTATGMVSFAAKLEGDQWQWAPSAHPHQRTHCSPFVDDRRRHLPGLGPQPAGRAVD